MYKSKRGDVETQNGSVRYKLGKEKNLLHGLRPRYLYTNPGLPSHGRSLARQSFSVLNAQGKRIGAAGKERWAALPRHNASYIRGDVLGTS